MKIKATILIILVIVLGACKSQPEKPINLKTQNWIHGSENCEENNDPAIQVVQYNSDTWIFRQSKCTNYEAPFLFLFLGKDKALLMDTGAVENDTVFPLYKTVNKIIKDWSELNGDVELVVAHTHKHGDHHAADSQFSGKPNTTVIGLEVEDVKNFFKVSQWPEEIVDFDLGDRLMKIIPIPGHQVSSIAVYDTSTKVLLTGDTFYPGRLYVEDWQAFKTSIERLVKFTDSHEVSTILGNHIEMTQTAGVDYPMGSVYQPDEHPLPLSVQDLKELSDTLSELGDEPVNKVHDSFIIFPVN